MRLNYQYLDIGHFEFIILSYSVSCFVFPPYGKLCEKAGFVFVKFTK